MNFSFLNDRLNLSFDLRIIFKKITFLCVIFFFIYSPANAKKNTFYVPFSSQQEWLADFIIGDKDLSSLKENGIYKVTFSEIASATGLSKSAWIPIQNLRLLTGKVDTLAQVAGGILAPNQLFEVPLRIVDLGPNGNANQIFDEYDTLYFYGHGTSYWKSTQQSNSLVPVQYPMQWQFHQNLNSFYHHYYLVSSLEANPLRFENGAQSFQPYPVVSLEKRYAHFEKENNSGSYDYAEGEYDDSTGAQWSWYPIYSNKTLTLGSNELLLGSIDTKSWSDSAWIQFRFLNNWNGINNLSSDINVSNNNVPLPLTGQIPKRAKTFALPFALNGASLNSIEAQFIQCAFLCYFDSYDIAYKEDPQFLSSRLILPDSGWGNQWSISSSNSGIEIYKIQNHEASGTWWSRSLSDQTQENTYYWVHLKGSELSVNQIKNVVLPSNGAIQNLLSGQSNAGIENPEYIIIAPQTLVSEAIALKKYRENEAPRKIKTSVVILEDIYKAYDAGRPSHMAIRNFLQWAKTSWAKSLQSVLLFGDGHFDIRQIKKSSPQSLVPTYEYDDLTSDDYYTILDSGKVISSTTYTRKIDIGRLPITTSQEAQTYLSKVRAYEKEGEMIQDAWRNRWLFAADDFRQRTWSDNIPHTQQADSLSHLAETIRPGLNIQKLFMLDYPIDLSGIKSAAAEEFIRQLNAGQLLTFYFGHGATNKLSDENLMDDATVPRVESNKKPTIFLAFACQSGRFDRPLGKSLSEKLFDIDQGGAIAAISATRVSYAESNERFAKEFVAEFLNQKHNNLSLGQAFNQAKNNILGYNNNSERYALLGEPVLTIPNQSISLNIQPIDTIQALQQLKIQGNVNGLKSGQVLIQVRQQNINRSATESYPRRNGNGIMDTLSYAWQTSGRTLYSEIKSFDNGVFSTEFITPRKLSFGDTNANIQVYAWQNGTWTATQNKLSKIKIFGTAKNADSLIASDKTPPSILAYPCQRQSNSDAYGSQFQLEIPACIEYEIKDSTGIDLEERPDEGISLEIVGRTNPFHPQLIEQSGKFALFRQYFTKDEALGKIQIKVRSQDILGNATSKTWNVELLETGTPQLADLYNVPNPMKTHTRFYFKVNRINDTRVNIAIYNLLGKLVRVLPNAVSGQSQWDGRDDWGNLLGNGLYYYKVFANQKLTNAEEKISIQHLNKLQKLVISR